MYMGLKLYDLRYTQMNLKEVSVERFEYGDEMSRIVYEAALCIEMGHDGVTLEGVYKGEDLLGKARLYVVNFVVEKVKVSVAFMISLSQFCDVADWVCNESVSKDKKVSVIRNFLIQKLVRFNKNIKEYMFSD